MTSPLDKAVERAEAALNDARGRPLTDQETEVVEDLRLILAALREREGMLDMYRVGTLRAFDALCDTCRGGATVSADTRAALTLVGGSDVSSLAHSDASRLHTQPGSADGKARFRKTATIEAVQWFRMGDHPAVILKSGPSRYADYGIPWIPTLEGGHVVTPGDWIATGAEGEHWPIKPEIFTKTYVRDDGRTERNLSEPVSPLTADLHRDTALLVNSFAIALAHKLLAAQKKYGFTNGWYTDDWEDKCRADLLAHVAKGDPLDVGAYAAFCWARCWSTSAANSVGTPEGVNQKPSPQ